VTPDDSSNVAHPLSSSVVPDGIVAVAVRRLQARFAGRRAAPEPEFEGWGFLW
jgi:hypothetical protein